MEKLYICNLSILHLCQCLFSKNYDYTFTLYEKDTQDDKYSVILLERQIKDLQTLALPQGTSSTKRMGMLMDIVSAMVEVAFDTIHAVTKGKEDEPEFELWL